MMSSDRVRTPYSIALMMLLAALFWHPAGTKAQPLETVSLPQARIAHDSVGSLNKKRLHWLIGGASATYGLGMTALNQLWYADHPKESFHFFNDNKEWKQVDKIGHFYTAFHLSQAGVHALQWAGLPHKKAVLWGSAVGMGVMVPIEVFDGFSSEYGASAGDLTANTLGAALFLGQGLLWGETRIHPKFSFRQSPYAQMRPKVLGENLSQALLKDYNGQTYWLSFDIYSLRGKKKGFPKWLNLALGYGAERMVHASDRMNTAQGFSAYRQYYLGLDIDLNHITPTSKLLKALIYMINLIHLPAPGISYNREEGIKAQWLQF